VSTAGWFTLSVFALILGLVALRLNAQQMEASRGESGDAEPRPAKSGGLRPAGLKPLRGGGGRGGPRDRKRWAATMEWEYLDADPVLPSRWRYGTIHQGGPGVARGLVTGSLLTDEGRRLVYIFDHEQAGRVTTTVAAVQRRGSMGGALELRMPSAPLPDDAGLDLLEPVGQRYAFVSDPNLIRPMITPRLVRAADAIGDEIELVWAEDAWVLAAAPLNTPPDALQDLLDQLVEVAAALDVSSRSGASLDRGGDSDRRPEADFAEFEEM
jgi:hypothetical protein